MFKDFRKFVRSLLPVKDSLNPRGYIEIEDENGVQLLGNNLVLTAYRQLIGSMLANQLTPGAAAYPTHLIVGTGTTDPARLDAALETAHEHLGTILKIPVSSVSYETDSTDVKVIFEFVLTSNVQVDGPGGETTEFLINEWGMLSADDTLLTRKVKTYTKTPGSVATVRWVIYI